VRGLIVRRFSKGNRKGSVILDKVKKQERKNTQEKLEEEIRREGKE
jgi:hypothetical protein